MAEGAAGAREARLRDALWAFSHLFEHHTTGVIMDDIPLVGGCDSCDARCESVEALRAVIVGALTPAPAEVAEGPQAFYEANP